MTSEGLELHYYSPCPGYGPWVVGMCEAVARDVFQSWAHFRLIRGRHDGSADHEVREEGASGGSTWNDRYVGGCLVALMNSVGL